MLCCYSESGQVLQSGPVLETIMVQRVSVLRAALLWLICGRLAANWQPS